jgi:DNA-binding response OmpR family regulator
MMDLEEEAVGYRPCAVLAHSDPAYAASATRAFRRRGWDVYTAETGPELRRLARMLGAGLAVLSADLPGESGWLTCTKLAGDQPLMKVILITAGDDPQQEQLGSFVGASAVLPQAAGVSGLLEEVEGTALPAAG